MPKSERASGGGIFESRTERAKREPIFYFTTRETDRRTSEAYEKKWVSVLGIELEVYDAEREGGEGTNFRQEEFDDFLHDDKAKAILKHFAIGVKLNHAPLIEGETDIGKTKALEYLAYLTNHKLVRVSVRGTTDPSEFFGKHVPESATAQQKILDAIKRKAGLTKEVRERVEKAQKAGQSFSLEDYKALADWQTKSLSGLQKEALSFFQKAVKEGRGLTREEWEQFAAIEGIDLESKMFHWQDGEVVKAMTRNNGHGYWIYIDEIGAAEPQILVALNRILEQQRRIELSEDGGRSVEAGKHFRLFASTNPPEYAGRLPLAPDFLRRWAYKKESPLSEKDIKERFAHIARVIPLEQEIRELFCDVLTVFHLSLRSSIKDILKKQKQKFNYEFSDLIRVRDYFVGLGNQDPLAALREGMEYAVFAKIGDEEQRKAQREAFETLLKSKTIPEKVKKIIEKRRISGAVGQAVSKMGQDIAGF
ncbi:AAA family ATPase [Candidatus Falkowbacteria bacterium]|nr:AAA family ATPase [Candidatus Falkowbacteria bacterium]